MKSNRRELQFVVFLGNYFGIKLHLKQNSMNKLLANEQGFVCPKCYKAGYKHHLVTTENQLFARKLIIKLSL